MGEVSPDWVVMDREQFAHCKPPVVFCAVQQIPVLYNGHEIGLPPSTMRMHTWGLSERGNAGDASGKCDIRVPDLQLCNCQGSITRALD
eukprot:7508093-Pyramimonas_sp.AAC.1